MNRQGPALAAILLMAVAFSGTAGGAVLAAPASHPAAQAPTPFLTPTPNADGEIIYEVKEGDTAWRIAAIAGISLEELYALNGLEPTDFLSTGTLLVLGQARPPQATGEPAAEGAATSVPPTPTPETGSGEICALLFDDVNGNARLDESELALAGGQVSVADAAGQVAGESTTVEEPADEDPVGVCFSDLEQGDYNVSGAVPEGYNPTTSMNTPVRLAPGDIKYVEFGAQASAALGGGVDVEGDPTSSLLGFVGVVFLLAAGVLGYFAARYNRQRPSMGR